MINRRQPVRPSRTGGMVNDKAPAGAKAPAAAATIAADANIAAAATWPDFSDGNLGPDSKDDNPGPWALGPGRILKITIFQVFNLSF